MIIIPLTLGAMLLVISLRFGWAGLQRLLTQPLRGGILAVLACMAQVLSVVTHRERFGFLIVTAVLLAMFCWLNRRRAGLWLIAAGITLNMLVMAANGGTMPINSQTLARMSSITASHGDELSRSKDRVLDDSHAVLPLLGDRLLLPGPFARLAAWSIGDVLLLSGVARLLWQTMKGTIVYDSTQWSPTPTS